MSKKISALTVAGILAVASLGSAPALAAEKGDWLVRFGASFVDPDDDSSVVKLNDAPVPNTGVEVDDNVRPSFTIAYMLTDNLAVEVLGALPFEHDIDGVGLDMLGIYSAGSTKHLPPTVSLQYHFNVTPQFKPYVGVGLNYTTFFDEKVSGQARAHFNKLKLDDSWGAAVQIGADYEFANGWLINADVRYIDIDTEGTLTGPSGRAKVDVDIDPMVYTIAVGKRF